jgi:periplasmic divalent cation tolerance protein
MTPELVEIVTTVDSEGAAVRLARELVTGGLVACANLRRVRSIYGWSGELQDEPEIEITLKTTAAMVERAEARLREIHPYDTPAVLRLPVLHANEEYAAWVVDGTRGEAE